jgi:hypothetical protein
MSAGVFRKSAEALFRLGILRFCLRVAIALGSAVGRVSSFLKIRALLKVPLGTACHWSVEIKYPKNVKLLGPVVIGPGCTLGVVGGAPRLIQRKASYEA